MESNGVQPLEQIETAFDNMYQEVSKAYTSIIEYLNGLFATFQDFQNNAQTIKVSIEGANLDDCFSECVQSISNIADNAANNMFFASIYSDGLKSIEDSYKNYSTLMETSKNTLSSIFQKIRSTINTLHQLNEQSQDQKACKEFHSTLMGFLRQFQSLKEQSRHSIKLGITHSHNAIKQIEDGTIVTVSLLMGKFNIDSEIHQKESELESIPILKKAVKKYFNFNYIYQKYIIRKSLLDESNVIDFFELESVNREHKIKVVTKEACKGFIKDHPIDLPDSQIEIPKGQEGQLIDCNGYSEAWYIKFPAMKRKCYVMADQLTIIHE